MNERVARIIDRLVLAYYGAICMLVLIPVVLFMGALALADWLDGLLGYDEDGRRKDKVS